MLLSSSIVGISLAVVAASAAVTIGYTDTSPRIPAASMNEAAPATPGIPTVADCALTCAVAPESSTLALLVIAVPTLILLGVRKTAPKA